MIFCFCLAWGISILKPFLECDFEWKCDISDAQIPQFCPSTFFNLILTLVMTHSLSHIAKRCQRNSCLPIPMHIDCCRSIAYNCKFPGWRNEDIRRSLLSRNPLEIDMISGSLLRSYFYGGGRVSEHPNFPTAWMFFFQLSGGTAKSVSGRLNTY